MLLPIEPMPGNSANKVENALDERNKPLRDSVTRIWLAAVMRSLKPGNLLMRSAPPFPQHSGLLPTDLVRPEVRDDETALSYKGLVLRLNGMFVMHPFAPSGRLLQAWAMQQANLVTPPLSIETLSVIAGQDTEAFVHQHTMAPLQGEYFWDRRRERSVVGFIKGALRACRPGAYFCPQCLLEDIRNSGSPHWRRCHQIPGIFWCTKHGAPLRVVEAPQAFVDSPSTHHGDSQPVSAQFVKRLISNPAVERFIAVETCLLQQPTRLPSFGFCSTLQELAVSQHLFFGDGTPRAKLLSDRFLEIYPHDWLSTFIPDLHLKVRGEIFRPIDRPSAHYSLSCYIAALCAMLENFEAAIVTLMIAGNSTRARPAPPNPPASDYRALYGAYVQSKGNHRRAASLLQSDEVQTRRALLQFALPALNSGQRNQQLLDALDRFVARRQPLSNACERAGIAQAYVESMLRQTVANLHRALSVMSKPRKGRWGTLAMPPGRVKDGRRTRGGTRSPSPLGHARAGLRPGRLRGSRASTSRSASGTQGLPQ